MNIYKVEISKTLNFTESDLSDILCSCFEGGCGYWCCIDNNTKEWKDAKSELKERNSDIPTLEDIMIELLDNDKCVKLIDQEDDDTEYSLNLDNFMKGIKISIEEGYWGGSDVCDVDGYVGDAIIQLALFDEVIYG